MLSWLGLKKGPGTDERRQIVRRKVYLDVVCHLPVKDQLDRDFKAVITDIGPGGLKLRSYENLTRGARFFVEYPGELTGVPWMRVKVVVIWAVKSKKTFESKAMDVEVHEGIFFDMLEEVFTQVTGLYTHF